MGVWEEERVGSRGRKERKIEIGSGRGEGDRSMGEWPRREERGAEQCRWVKRGGIMKGESG